MSLALAIKPKEEEDLQIVGSVESLGTHQEGRRQTVSPYKSADPSPWRKRLSALLGLRVARCALTTSTRLVTLTDSVARIIDRRGMKSEPPAVFVLNSSAWTSFPDSPKTTSANTYATSLTQSSSYRRHQHQRAYVEE